MDGSNEVAKKVDPVNELFKALYTHEGTLEVNPYGLWIYTSPVDGQGNVCATVTPNINVAIEAAHRQQVKRRVRDWQVGDHFRFDTPFASWRVVIKVAPPILWYNFEDSSNVLSISLIDLIDPRWESRRPTFVEIPKVVLT